jgi:disulfide bond formation protein DsbB
MKKSSLILIALVLLCSLILTACGGGEPEGPQGDAVAGKAKFATTCVSCHGPEGKGMPGLGKDLTTSDFVTAITNTDLVEFLKIGRPASDPANTQGVDMPPRGGNPALTDDDLLNIVAYLREIHVK